MCAFDFEIDEALWAAYRRYNKAAVTEKLLRRYLDRVTRPQSPEPALITNSGRVRAYLDSAMLAQLLEENPS